MHRQRQGFTLIEIIVVIACIAVLAGIIAPLAYQAIEDARISRAESDTKAIATAVFAFYDDLGFYPIYEEYGDAPTPDILSLVSRDNDSVDPAVEQYWARAFGALPQSVFALDRVLSSNLDSANEEIYNTDDTQGTVWDGAYLTDIGLDPWGNPYVVYTGGLWPDEERVAQGVDDWCRAWAVSAGPDGVFTSSVNCQNNELTLQDDDIGVRLK